MAHTTGHGKVSVCGLFAATASEHKFPVICLVKSKNPIVGLRAPPNIILAYSPKGIYNEPIVFGIRNKTFLLFIFNKVHSIQRICNRY